MKVGDRVEVESERVGLPTREGVVRALRGRLITIRWDDGSESSLLPKAGVLRVKSRAGRAGAKAPAGGSRRASTRGKANPSRTPTRETSAKARAAPKRKKAPARKKTTKRKAR